MLSIVILLRLDHYLLGAISKNEKNVTESISNCNPSSLFLRGVEDTEIINVVNKFENKSSTDCSNLNMRLVKEIINHIVTPLTYICNLSFCTGVFPSKMKTAKVIPIYKNGSKHLFKNYRPISLLSQFSKILEKLFVTRFDGFVKFNLLNEQQFGFRSNRSTLMAVMALTEDITTAVEEKKYTLGVFIDLSKAFDVMGHTLLQKLQRYGIRGTAYAWVASYLRERDQYVHINNVDSRKEFITHGVPQGSTFGPKLFTMYINDVCAVLDKVNCLLYADDTSLYCSGDDLNKLVDLVEKELAVLKGWFDGNKISMNMTKTKYIMYGNRKITNEIIIKINGIVIEQVHTYTFLGITIDEKLSWKPHIDYIKLKISKKKK
uniref:Reverse transcriptase domain-containing protein n=1 Tax=Nothobranchius furzeri TaxID=105023 RepID=A0A8C6LIA0_NOTFU